MKTVVPYSFCAQRPCARAVVRDGPPQVALIQIRFERLTFFKPLLCGGQDWRIAKFAAGFLGEDKV